MRATSKYWHVSWHLTVKTFKNYCSPWRSHQRLAAPRRSMTAGRALMNGRLLLQYAPEKAKVTLPVNVQPSQSNFWKRSTSICYPARCMESQGQPCLFSSTDVSSEFWRKSKVCNFCLRTCCSCRVFRSQRTSGNWSKHRVFVTQTWGQVVTHSIPWLAASYNSLSRFAWHIIVRTYMNVGCTNNWQTSTVCALCVCVSIWLVVKMLVPGLGPNTSFPLGPAS